MSLRREEPMLEDFFVVPAAAQRLRDGALGAHLDGFCTRLSELGYRRPTIRHTLWVISRLAAWMASEHVAVRDLDEHRMEEFLDARRRRGRPWRRLTPHTLRHTAAMQLLGVASTAP
jgi:hypothetical protein